MIATLTPLDQEAHADALLADLNAAWVAGDVAAAVEVLDRADCDGWTGLRARLRDCMVSGEVRGWLVAAGVR